jgi:hypothetical protein
MTSYHTSLLDDKHSQYSYRTSRNQLNKEFKCSKYRFALDRSNCGRNATILTSFPLSKEEYENIETQRACVTPKTLLNSEELVKNMIKNGTVIEQLDINLEMEVYKSLIAQLPECMDGKTLRKATSKVLAFTRCITTHEIYLS